MLHFLFYPHFFAPSLMLRTTKKCEKYSVCPHIILGFLAVDIEDEMEVGQSISNALFFVLSLVYRTLVEKVFLSRRFIVKLSVTRNIGSVSDE